MRRGAERAEAAAVPGRVRAAGGPGGRAAALHHHLLHGECIAITKIGLFWYKWQRRFIITYYAVRGGGQYIPSELRTASFESPVRPFFPSS